VRDYIDPAYKTIMYSQGGTPPPGFGGEPERRQISAGKFEKTPEGLRFAGSPEALEAIRRVKERTGLDLEVFPNDPSESPNVMGYFMRGAEEGGSYDPVKRRIYMNPSFKELPQFVLEHETGHAVDPLLPKSYKNIEESYRVFTDKYNSGKYNTPAEGLADYMLGLPRRKLDTELTAQRYAKDRMSERGLSDSFTEEDLAEYPLAYIDQGLRSFDVSTALSDRNIVPDSMFNMTKTQVFDPMTSLYAQPPAPYLMPNANTRVEYAGNLTNALLDLYNTPGYAEQVAEERQRAEIYAKRRLQE
jgi:hypothetical protein